MAELIQFSALGIGAGGLYALAAIGVVLVYRCSGVVNFAQLSIGMVGAYVYFELHVEHGLPAGVAMAGAFVGSAIVGVAFHLVIMNRMRDASVLAKVVATLALLVTLQGVATIRYGVFPKRVPSLLPNDGVEISGVSVGEDRIWIFVIAVGLTAILWAIYRYTTFGVATSAVAENPRAAAALTISPNAIAAANWAVGSALGALAAVLLVPITTLQPSAVSFLVIPVLAAAVVGRFSSFPLTTAAGLGIGVTQALITSPQFIKHDFWQIPGLPTAVPFVLVAVVLISRGRSVVGKDERFGRMPALGSGKITPGLVAFGIIVSLVCIWVLFPEDWLIAFEIQIIVAVVLMSFVVITGYAGQVSLAQGAFAGIGALVAAWLNASKGWPLELAALAGMAAVVPAALIVGTTGIRTRGVNLAIVTLGFAIAMEPVVFTNPDYTGGSLGFKGDIPSFLGVSIDPVEHPERYATFALAILTIVGFAIANLRRGRAGRRLIAVRTNERAAAALGVSVVGAKLYAFALGGVIAAVGGILVTFRQSILEFGGFGGITSLFVMQNAVIGGVGLLSGPAAGSGFQPGTVGQQLIDYLPGDPALVLIVVGGIGLMVMLSFFPDGLAELQRRANAPLLRAVRSRLPHRRPTSEVLLARAEVALDQRVAPQALRTKGLTVRFGGVVALADLSLTVEPGEVVGLIGPNGAGKSTAIEAITGFVTPSGGSVTLGGVPIDGLSRERRARAGLSRSFQSLELFDDLTVLENIQTACDERDLGAYVTDLVKPGIGHLTSAARTAIADFGFEDVLDTKVVNLSYAERRMLAVARAVAGGQSVLLLDEPASGLDDVQTRRLGESIRRLAADRGVAVLLIEHNVDMVLRTCDRIYALDFGELIASGTPAEIRTHPRVIDAYLGTARFREDESPSVDVRVDPALSDPASV